MLPAAILAAEPQREYIGVIYSLSGAAEHYSPPTTNTLTINSPGWRWKPVFVGDHMRTFDSGMFIIQASDGSRLTNNSTNLTIFKSRTDLSHLSQRNLSAQKALLDGLKIMGISMSGNSSQLIQPCSGGVIMSTNTVIRWIPSDNHTPFKLSFCNVQWSAEVSHPETGCLVDTNLPTSLERIRRLGMSVILELSYESGSTESVCFSVLSEINEHKLNDALAAALQDVKDPEVALLARAGIYRRFRLFNNAAETYDALLELPCARYNSNLISIAIGMHQAIGNKSKVAELQRLLEESSR